MSPNVGNFVHDLVEMAKAMEALPSVQLDLHNAQVEIDRLQGTVQRLELKLIDRANEIDQLRLSVREAEVAKDAAETMFLEADDRTARAVEFIKAQFGAAGSLIQALEPAKPQPMVEETVQHIEPIPTPVDSTLPEPKHDMFPEPEYYQKAEGQHSEPQGQSAPGPMDSVHTVDTQAAALPSAQTDVSDVGVESAADPIAQGEPNATGSPVQSPIATISENAYQPTTIEPSSDTGSMVSEDIAMPLDPEPNERWSNEWWAWKDRQAKHAAE